MTPRVSIVISTLNRAESLRKTLLSLRQLDYPEFEVVVVVGPSTDDTDAVVSEFGDEIKVGRIDEPNLSASRNIGIRLSSGELVAFIDDDSVPDPWWLNDIVPAFQDGEVAAAGGPVYDFDGASLFSRYSLVDIHGDTMIWTDGPNPSRALAAPLSNLVAYPIGTNAVFRRSVLVASRRVRRGVGALLRRRGHRPARYRWRLGGRGVRARVRLPLPSSERDCERRSG